MMDEQALLPPALGRAGFRMGNELAWLRPDAIAVLDEFERLGLGILGAELWSVRNGQVFACLPDGYDGWTTTDWRKSEEAWVTFVARSVAEAKTNVMSRPEGHGMVPSPAYSVLYNFCVVAESEYPGAA
jgi:hypothetical protein